MWLTENNVKILVSTRLANRQAVTNVLSNTGTDDLPKLRELLRLGILKGDWRRSEVRRRIAYLEGLRS